MVLDLNITIDGRIGYLGFPTGRNATRSREGSSAEYLRDHLQEVPVNVIPCIAVRTEGMPTVMQSEVWGSLLKSLYCQLEYLC